MLNVEAVTTINQSLVKNHLEIGETGGRGGGDCWLDKGGMITFQTDFIVSTEREGHATDTEDEFIADVDTIEQISILNLSSSTLALISSTKAITLTSSTIALTSFVFLRVDFKAGSGIQPRSYPQTLPFGFLPRGHG